MAEVSFGEWLKRRRGAEGWTQKHLAQQVNCSVSALRKIEAEVRRPSAEVIARLAEIFSIPQNERKSFLRFARGDWQAISSHADQDAPWHVAHVAPRSNLPVSTTSFIGREKEQEEIKHLLLKDRLVTLTGAGGIGKSRLSIQAGSALLNDFPDGTWLVELAPVSDPALVAQVVLTTLGLIEQTNCPPQAILIDFLKAKKSLIILDNCEHLIQASAQLAEALLRSCPDLHILASSREALSIPGETVYRVPSLTTPDPRHSTLDTLSRYEAVQLFLERAQAVLRDFSLTQDNALAISQVCQRLDGIPLALELAAARVKLLRVEEIADRLDDRFRLLTGGTRTALPRHQTLQAMIDWSYDLLIEPERVLVRRLSVFAGGWTLEAAEAVCADLSPTPSAASPIRKGESAPPSLRGKVAKHAGGEDGGLGPTMLDLLTSLANKSLILVERKQGQETRYRMLETIRQYAHEKLWQAGEGELLSQRHLAYFVDLAERAEPNLRAFDMVMWLDRLEAELDNIRSALDYALESDIEAQLRLASALLWFWHIRGHRNEGLDLLERGLTIEANERGNQALAPSRVMIRGKALNVAGLLALGVMKLDRGTVLSEESLALFQGLGTLGKQGMAYALCNLAAAADQTQQLDRRVVLFKEALALFQEIGDKFGIAQSIYGLWDHAWGENDYEQTRSLLEQQLALRHEIGDKDGQARAFLGLGSLAFLQGNFKEATIHHEASLALFREVGNRWAIGWVLSSLGRVALAQGNYGQATIMLEQALAVDEDLGDKVEIAKILNELGLVARSQGDYESATRWHEEALVLFREADTKFPVAYTLRNLGLTALAQSHYDQAVENLEEALSISKEADDKFETGFVLYSMGKVAQAQGNSATARKLNVEAMVFFRERCDPEDIPVGMAHCLETFAVLAVAKRQMKQAICLFSISQKLYHPLRFEMSAKERAEHDEAIAAARAALGEEAFAKAWAEGQAMTLEEAVAYAPRDS